jgi:hypothetical protein
VVRKPEREKGRCGDGVREKQGGVVMVVERKTAMW